MNPHSNFLSIYTLFSGVEVIFKFVPLVQLMAQVAETHFHTRLLTEICLSNFQTTFGK